MKLLVRALKFMVVALCVCSILSNTVRPPVEDYTKIRLGHPWEKYDPSIFHKFQSINDLIEAADKQFQPSERHTLKYYEFIDSIVEQRFYHDYSHYSINDNPVAFLAGKFWYNLSAIVIPEDIMKHSMAACSQQSIVLMEIFRRQHIDTRKIGFDHHYALEGKINGHWYFFDPNVEPDFQHKRESFQALVNDGRFKPMYLKLGLSQSVLDRMTGHPYYGKVNAKPAPKVILLHKIGWFVKSSYFLWFALAAMISLSVRWSLVKRFVFSSSEQPEYSVSD